MNILAVAVLILVVSFLLALKDMKLELTVPDQVRKIKIKKKKKLSGVILFLKKKIIHYSSSSD